MLRRNKALSIAMTLCLCLAILAPVFVAPPAAEAAVTYQALSVPTVSTNTAGQPLGIIQVDIDNCAAIRAGDVLTISFSSEINLAPPAGAAPVAVAVSAARTAGNEIVVPATIGTTPNALDSTAGATYSFTSANVSATRTTLDITFSGNFRAAAASNPGRMLIYFPAVTVGSIEDEVTAMVLGPASGAFPSGSITVAKVVGSNAGTTNTIKSAKTFGSNGLPVAAGGTDTIIISENAPGVLMKAADTSNNIIKLKLPNGFRWTGGAGNWAWGWGTAALGAGIAVDATDNRILTITVPVGTQTTAATGSGQIRFAGFVAVDDAVAKEGEVVAHVSDTLGYITESDLTIGNYASFGVKVVEGDVADLLAGKANQKLGKFYIQEGIAGSLLNNRSIKLTLPQGVKWWAGYRDQASAPCTAGVIDAPFDHLIPNPNLLEGTIAGTVWNDADANNAGTQAFAVGAINSGANDQGRTIKFSTTNLSTGKAKIEFKNMYVDVSPDFTGDVIITVSSTAGVEGEVKVASVKPRVELKAENVTNIRIGEQTQTLGDLTITETKKEALALRNEDVFTNDVNNIAVAAQNTNLSLALPAGATWAAGYPKVEVTEGDLDLDTASMSKAFNAVTGIHSINIPIKSESTKASTIKITGLKATLNRTIPEGDFKIAVSGLSVNETGGLVGVVELPFAQFEGNKVAIAKCVTPAPDEGTAGAASGQFRIDSNIYQVNGVSKIMDVAPYVKNNRTYVPVRFLGYALGLTDADIVWDEATQKVTFTQGSNVVELTIGSTTYTVNGESKTMDVAPEITNGRTMLPARYVAEGLGYVVGWDPATQTVLVSK